MEKVSSILEMNVIFTQLCQKSSTWSADATGLLGGSASPFEGAGTELSHVRDELLEPCDLDASTIDVLQVRNETTQV